MPHHRRIVPAARKSISEIGAVGPMAGLRLAAVGAPLMASLLPPMRLPLYQTKPRLISVIAH
jgi:hypothetical protein